ncbi:hypothetical protein D9M69_711910 [compost metagenome]
MFLEEHSQLCVSVAPQERWQSLSPRIKCRRRSARGNNGYRHQSKAPQSLYVDLLLASQKNAIAHSGLRSG